MAAPSLRLRVIASGLAVLALLLLVIGATVQLLLRAQLLRDLELVAADRVALVRELAAAEDDLPAALRRTGIPAEVLLADGSTRRGAPLAPQGDSALFSEQADQRVIRGEPIVLADGSSVVVEVSRLGVDRALRRQLDLLLAASVAGLLVGAGLLWLACQRALHPLDQIVAVAGRVQHGGTAERLRPVRADTEVGALAQAIDRMLDALAGALTAAQASDQRSRSFLARAAHQLRSPAAAVQMTAETLVRARDHDERERLLDILLRETTRSVELVEDLLRLARLDGAAPLRLQSLDLADLVDEEARRAADLSPDLQLDRTAEPNLASTRMQGDPELLRAAVTNLLDNARRHAAHRIDVVLGGGAVSLRARIGDDGPGLPSGEEERAFERFTSLDGQGGSGLGLAIARDAARAHGGDLTYREGAFHLSFEVGQPDRSA